MNSHTFDVYSSNCDTALRIRIQSTHWALPGSSNDYFIFCFLCGEKNIFCLNIIETGITNDIPLLNTTDCFMQIYNNFTDITLGAFRHVWKYCWLFVHYYYYSIKYLISHIRRTIGFIRLFPIKICYFWIDKLWASTYTEIGTEQIYSRTEKISIDIFFLLFSINCCSDAHTCNAIEIVSIFAQPKTMIRILLVGEFLVDRQNIIAYVVSEALGGMIAGLG